MRLTHHAVTIALLAVGLVIAIALTIATGYWIDFNKPLGTTGILPFLCATAVIFLCVEAIAGATGEWIERHVLHHV